VAVCATLAAKTGITPVSTHDLEEMMRMSSWLRGLLPAVLFAVPLVAAAQGEVVVYCTVQENGAGRWSLHSKRPPVKV
jgi:hypothetical protein